jgi:hypothetical protein
MKQMISRSALDRLALEIFRQALYDWADPDLQPEISEFFASEWARELAELNNSKPEAAFARLKDGVITSRDFYAGAGPLLDKYVSTKNSRHAGPLSLDKSLSCPRKESLT